MVVEAHRDLQPKEDMGVHRHHAVSQARWISLQRRMARNVRHGTTKIGRVPPTANWISADEPSLGWAVVSGLVVVEAGALVVALAGVQVGVDWGVVVPREVVGVGAGAF